MTQQDAKAFRSAVAQFPTGVTVVTTVDSKGNKIGITANSFSSVSLDPTLVLWSISKKSKVFDAFNEAKYMAIHILTAEQKDVSNQFASNVEDRFAGVDYSESYEGLPVLNDFSALFLCDIENRFEGGDHIILMGRVVDFANREQAPLIFHAGRYADLPVAEL